MPLSKSNDGNKTMNNKHDNKSYYQKTNKEIYKCLECGFKYKEKEWADKCQKWCKENKTCNLEIIKHAIRKQ